MKLAAITLCLFAAPAFAQGWPVVPDPAKTPGEVRALTKDQICATKWGKDERLVTAAMKEEVYKAYGVPITARHITVNGKVSSAFEVDHLISRELGGADSVKNLWPEPYTGPWNAHMKDKLENKLHVEVCAGRVDLAVAQKLISGDWRVPYAKYYGQSAQ